jgi:hypothetical protein
VQICCQTMRIRTRTDLPPPAATLTDGDDDDPQVLKCTWLPPLTSPTPQMSQIFSPTTIKQRKSVANRSSKSTKGSSKRVVSSSPSSSSSSSSDDDDDDTLVSANRLQPTPAPSNQSDEIFVNVMKQSQWKVKTSGPDRRTDFSRICSICLRERRDGKARHGDNDLITPCLCVGHRSWQHRRCVEEWIEQTGAVGCPFCNVRYEFTKSKKGFMCYVSELELQKDFLVNLGVFVFAVYLFFVGLTICYQFVFAVYECDPQSGENLKSSDPLPKQFTSWQELEKLVDCHRSLSAFERTHSWPSIILFCFTCVGTILLFISIISLCLNMIVKHYIKYLLWSKTNFRVSVQPYRLWACKTNN